MQSREAVKLKNYKIFRFITFTVNVIKIPYVFSLNFPEKLIAIN